MTKPEALALAEKAAAIADENHNRGMNCAEAVLSAVLSLGLSPLPMECVMLASGLGGGVGRSGNLCGAVNGGALAIGAALGRVVSPDDRRSREEIHSELSKDGGIYETARNYIGSIAAVTGGVTACCGLKYLNQQLHFSEEERAKYSCPEIIKLSARQAVLYILGIEK